MSAYITIVVISLLNCLASSQVCLCDSTSICDLLCCCDPDCNSDEKASFTCDTSVSSTSTTDEVCFSKDLFSRYTIDDGYSVTTENDRYCFSSLSPVISSSTVTKSLKASSIDLRNANLPFAYSKDFKKIALSREVSKVYDPVYIHSEDSGVNSPLVLPAGLRTNCVRDSVLYLRNSSSTCSLKITSEVCQSGSKVDGSTYVGLKFLSNFRNYTTFNETTREVGFELVEVTATCYDESNTAVTCSTPTVSSSNCLNVLYKIDLVVLHTTSITSAEFKLYLKTTAIDSTSTLATTVSFQSVSNDYPIVGPRYQRYKPNFGVYFNVSKEKTFFTPFKGDTSCTTGRKIEFPFSSITSCSKAVSLASTDFPGLVSGLYGGLPSALAKYYNSELGNPDEWLALEWQIPELINATNVPTLLEMTINHKSFGSRTYPENDIISVVTSVSTSNLQALNNQDLLRDKVVFYFSVRFFSVDADNVQDEHVFDRLSRTFPDYSFPFRMLFVAVVVFVVLSLGILIWEQGKPEF